MANEEQTAIDFDKIDFETIDIDTQKLFMGEKETYVNKLSSREMNSLTALCDTFLPSVKVPNDDVLGVDESAVKFFGTSASMAGTPDYVGGLISEKLRSHVFLTRVVFVLLSTWIGTLILCGKASISIKYPFFHRFSDLDLKTRQKIAISWSLSPIGHLRQLFFGLKALILLAFFTQVNDNNENPTWKAIGYCGPDPDFKAQSKATAKVPKQVSETQDDNIVGPLHKCIINMSSPKEKIAQSLRSTGFRVNTHPKNHKKPDHRNPGMTIRCDAVVVGSGSGGGVVAGVLAKAGYKVLVLEKGSYNARQNLSLLEGQTLSQMYEFGGLLPTRDVSVMILAGSTVGGGSTVNWSTSIKTPSHVMREWSEEHELELFDSDLYKEAMNVVCGKMDVQGDVEEEGLNNEVLRRGCTELGYPVETIPRNAPKDHYCGWCFMGCKDGRKKGTMETWLIDLMESNNGMILPNCEVTKVLYSSSHSGRRGKTKGVIFEYGCKNAREVCVVESKVTIVACGALNTPALLSRSGLRNPNIGKNLHLHPVTMAWGYFPEDLEAKSETRGLSYEGGIMTSMSKVVADFNGSGYGALIQTPSLHPGLFSALMPWTSGTDIKVRMSKFSRTAHLIALARDKGSGKVSPENPADVQYNISSVDEANLKLGVQKMLRILAAAGAEVIGTQHRTGPKLNVKTASSHEFERFVKNVSSMDLKGHSAPFASAHQMGSCRMGVCPKTSVVDQRGESWEVEGLFVADTSVFPTALGVNPMVTVMAISYCTALGIVEVLKRKRTMH